MEYRRQGHSVYYTRYHLVITTKYKRKIFNAGACAYLKLAIKSITKYHPEIQILEINTDQDHAHMLISVPPKISINQAVNIIKSKYSSYLKKKVWLSR